MSKRTGRATTQTVWHEGKRVVYESGLAGGGKANYERSKRMSKVIRAICDNGYDGVLIPNHSMTIRFKGERVLATNLPAPKNYDELMDVLETMPQFMDMLNEQVKNAVSKGART